MKRIAASKFREKCLTLLDSIGPEGIIITKRGKPVAKLVPVDKEKDDIFGFFKGKIEIKGDIVSPAFSPEEWGDLY